MHCVTHTTDLACRRQFIGMTDQLKALILQAMHFFIIANLQGWQLFLIVLAGILALLFIEYQCISCVGQHVPTGTSGCTI
jgi:hypothetical protein